MKFQDPIMHGSKEQEAEKMVRTEGRTNSQSKTNMPRQLYFKAGVIIRTTPGPPL